LSPRVGITIETILQAAAEIADQDGFHSVSLATLSKKLNIRTPSIYNHINGLDGLRTRLASFSIMKLHASLTLAVTGRSGDEAVFELAKSYLLFARTHPGLYEATLMAPNPDDEDVIKAGESIVDLCVRVLRAYELGEAATLHAIRGLRSLLHGFASLEQKQGFQLSLDKDRSFELLIENFVHGIHLYKGKEN